MDTYSVSRHTVREAVRRIQDAGLITRTRGRGSQRSPTALEQPLGTLYSLFRSVENAGLDQTSVVLRQELVVDEEAAKVLDLGVDARMFHLERIRLADNEPLAFDSVWLPEDIGRELIDVNFTHTALYDEMRKRCGLVPEEGTEQISPIVVERPVSLHLGLDDGSPAFRIDRRTAAGGRRLEWRVTTIAGDRFAFRAVWNSPYSEAATHLVLRPDDRP
jgi:GntR family transcriptional regulator